MPTQFNEEQKENIISIITGNLYSIHDSNQRHVFSTDKCDEIAQFIFDDLKPFFTQFSPPIEDGNIKGRLMFIRNNLYEGLPTGKISDWDWITLIKNHLKSLDDFIDKNFLI